MWHGADRPGRCPSACAALPLPLSFGRAARFFLPSGERCADREVQHSLFIPALVLSVAIHAATLAWSPVRHATERRLPIPLFATLRLPPAAPQPQELSPERHPPPHTARVVRATPVRPVAPPPRVAAVRVPAPSAVASAPVQSAVGVAAPSPVSEAPMDSATKMPPVAPVAGLQTVDAGALERYIHTLSELFSRKQRYPRLAEARGWEGDVQLRLHVAGKGTRVTVEVLHSSGFQVLDQHALQLVQDTIPLPVPPAVLQGGEFQITVPIHYKLQRST
jgi:periplasmic protein TonB